MTFTLTDQPIDPTVLRRGLLRVDAGGFCAFEGWVRNHHLGRQVTHLEYEAYGTLALKQGAFVLTHARTQYDLLDCCTMHRLGVLAPGDMAVWVGVCAAHRDTAFEACRFIIDDIKATVPIWKHEFYADGSDEWIDPTACHCDHRHSTKEARA